MPIAVTDDQRALADAMRAWAARTRPGGAARAQATDPDAWRGPYAQLSELGVLAGAVPDSLGGGGGTPTDLAVALEQAAAALVPGPALSSALAAEVLGGHPSVARLATGELTAGVALAGGELRAEVEPDGSVTLHGRVGPVYGATPGSLLLVPAGAGEGADSLFVLDGAEATVKLEGLDALDFSMPIADVQLDGARAAAVDGTAAGLRDRAAAFAAAEAAGLAQWCLATAVDHATVREQFGAPIGSFQAVKHLCAGMLCRAEVAAALAWDAAECARDAEQGPLAAAAAAALALDAAVDNAKDCIQVLGGIGFTWEHDAHLYLRRAVALRQWLGGSGRWRRRVTELTAAGTRRTLRVALPDTEGERSAVRAQAEAIAAAPAPDRRVALAESGYLMPHWPRPYGLDAGPARQLIVDEELERAGVDRPALVIAGWAVPTILKHGSPEQVARFVAPTLRGEITWCQLFSEPGAGSDLASLRTRAERVEGGWRLTGQKVWTSVAQEADWGICLARTDPVAPKHKGITYFLVDMRSAGLDIRPLREITGAELFNEVFLDDVFVPDELVVGDVNGGWALARTTLAHERVAMGSGSSIGDAVERLVADAAARGRLDDAATAERVGALIANGLAGSLLDLRTTLRRLDGQDDPAGAGSSVRKLVGVEHRQAVAEAALELQGPDGLVAGEQLHEFLTSRCLSIAGGTTQVLRTLAAERVLGLPRA